MPPDDLDRLRHIIEYGEAALRFIQDRQRADLDTDVMLRLALVRAIEVIGEAATQVTPAMRSRHPQVPWPQLAGMRNRLIHAYFDIDPDILWKAASEEVPALLPLVRDIIEKE